ncbi:MAG TPA: condensation domain-containing protein [Candidatus Acidoferrales bacterium]|nr:condensation domain-containing protein [Candidatus Acidoferrales bacterium]
MSTAALLSDAKRKLLDKFVREKFARPIEVAAISRCQSSELAPLALAQEQVLMHEQMVKGIPLYNESVTLTFHCPMDRTVLERSVAEVIRRHEIWRTSYDTVRGQPVQVVHPASERFPLPLIDLRHIPGQEREVCIRNLGLSQTVHPFELRRGPLLRAALVAMADTEYRLVMSAHQSIVDGVSVYQIFPVELFAIYRAFSSGQRSPLPEPPLQFSDFARWQREWLSPTEKAKQIAYWRQKLAGQISVPSWPSERARPAERTFRGRIRGFTLPRTVADAAHRLGQRQGTTMFVVLLAGFYSLLHHYTGQDDLIVGTLSPAGRKRCEVHTLLGYFLNPVALRVNLGDDPPFVELLRRVQIAVSEAISNDDVPFEHVVEALRPLPDSSRNPYFNIGISLQPRMPDSGGAWTVTSMDAESGGAMLDLYVAFIDRPEGLHARVQYNPDIFEFREIRRMVEDLQALMQTGALRPQERVSKLYSK